VDTAKNTQRVLSLCSGVRGIERGVERALEGIGQKLDTIAYVEIEAFIITNVIAGMEAGILDSRPIWANLKTFPWESFHGKVHGIIGGYPCQPFSVAGRRAGVEDPRHLWPHIAKGIGAIKPVWCFFENVPGHLTLGYEIVRRDLQEMGYHVEEGIFSAEEVGAPHRRERLFILAVLANTKHNNGRRTERRIHYKAIGKSCSKRPSFGSEEMANPNNKYRGLSESEELANSDNQRLQGLRECGTKKGWKKPHGYTRSCGQVWPARPGEQQHDWEEPRTTLAPLGSYANGYNFREDLLRALGNGVVEQTAEIAWNTLWAKQLNYSYRR
jgi:DNA (cytosine-5)-methyltransferase 1